MLGELESEFGSEIILLKKYVDDIILCIHRDSKYEALEFVNKLDPDGNLKFTIEIPVDGFIPYLDLGLLVNNNGTIDVDWYIKPTHSGSYLNYFSYCPVG